MLQARKRHSCSDSSKKFFHYGETKRVIYMQDMRYVLDVPCSILHGSEEMSD